METYQNEKQYQASINRIWQLITNPADDSWRSNISHVTVSSSEYAETNRETGYPSTYTDIHDEVPLHRMMKIHHIDDHGSREFKLHDDGHDLTTLTIAETFDSHAGQDVQPLMDQFF